MPKPGTWSRFDAEPELRVVSMEPWRFSDTASESRFWATYVAELLFGYSVYVLGFAAGFLVAWVVL